MYFPYLRGKQFELIALRELAPTILDPNKIIPILEPLKRNVSGLKTALRILNKAGVRVQLIINPEHGELKDKSDILINLVQELVIENITNIIPTFLVNSDKDFILVQSAIQQNGFDETGYALVHINQIRETDRLSALTKSTNCLFNTIQVNHLIALKRKYGNRSFLSDNFKKQRVNADYIGIPDEVFSSDYLYYSGEGCIAFSDYQIIGVDYVEGGGAALAVAIHLTYKDPHSDDIRIAHFVSDSNGDRNDPGGKFFEALSKLIVFVDNHQIDSLAIRQFRDYYDRQAFPGLGVSKKLSIMHHIELVQSLI